MNTNRFLFTATMVSAMLMAACAPSVSQMSTAIAETQAAAPTPSITPSPTATAIPTATPSWKDFEPDRSWHLNTQKDYGFAYCLAYTITPCRSWTYVGKGVIMMVYENTIVFDVEYYGDTPGADILSAIRQATKLFGVPKDVVEALLALQKPDWGKPLMLDGWGYQANLEGGAIELIFVRGGVH